LFLGNGEALCDAAFFDRRIHAASGDEDDEDAEEEEKEEE
jgi:hypothetical protein